PPLPRDAGPFGRRGNGAAARLTHCAPRPQPERWSDARNRLAAFAIGSTSGSTTSGAGRATLVRSSPDGSRSNPSSSRKVQAAIIRSAAAPDSGVKRSLPVDEHGSAVTVQRTSKGCPGVSGTLKTNSGPVPVWPGPSHSYDGSTPSGTHSSDLG